MPVGANGNAAHMQILPVALGLCAAIAAVAAMRAVLRLRYVLRSGRQVVRVDLVLFGCWRRRWRVPAHGTARLAADFLGRVARTTVPGRSPARPPSAGRRSPVWRGLHHLRGRVRLSRLRLRIVVGSGDPALSAVLVGCAHAVIGAGTALLPAYFRLPGGFLPEVAALPDYRRLHLRVELDCIADTSLGHLILAVLLALQHNGRAGRGGGEASRGPYKGSGAGRGRERGDTRCKRARRAARRAGRRSARTRSRD